MQSSREPGVSIIIGIVGHKARYSLSVFGARRSQSRRTKTSRLVQLILPMFFQGDPDELASCSHTGFVKQLLDHGLDRTQGELQLG
jgi:hypothetical protein